MVWFGNFYYYFEVAWNNKSIKATVNSNKITLGKDDFETRFVEVLNRSGGGETDNINKEFIILAILDGKR